MKVIKQKRRFAHKVEGLVSGSSVLLVRVYRGTSLIRKSADLAPYGRAMPRALWWS